MTKLKRLANAEDEIVRVIAPVSTEELHTRHELYDILTPSRFAKRLIDSWTEPVKIVYRGTEYPIQMNFCTNPFCKWFGQQQVNFTSLPYKPSRYRLIGKEESKSISCNPDLTGTGGLPVFEKETARIYSNWAIADEIARLAKNNAVIEITPEYDFHRDDCLFSNTTPFDTQGNFL